MTRNRKIAAMACVIALLAAALTISASGRNAMAGLLSFVKAGPRWLAGESAMVAVPTQDVEARARAKHGWANVNSSLVRGAITYFEDGLVSRQARITIYRKYPDRVRVEIEQGGLLEAFGFDHNSAWRLRSATLSEDDARDVRAWLRLSPERLFVTRGANARYRETGDRIEDSRPFVPGQGARNLRPAKQFDVVELEDTVGLPPTPSRVGDLRLISYFVNKDDSTIDSARWLEPDDASRRIEDPDTPMAEVRVDFAGWRRVNGVLWPMEMVVWRGGKADFRIDLSEVLPNHQMPDTLFQKP